MQPYHSLQDQSHSPSLQVIMENHALWLLLYVLRELLKYLWEQFDDLTDNNNLLPHKVHDPRDHPYTSSDVCLSLL